jgi:hypothetical protein
MKHVWQTVGDYQHCVNCDQFWPTIEYDYFIKINKLPCPNYNNSGTLYIEASRTGEEPYFHYDTASNFRQVLELCYLKFDNYFLRTIKRLDSGEYIEYEN